MENGHKHQWCTFVDRLNNFIKDNHDKIRKIEDKQIGYRFINEDIISEEKIKNKLMFFLWDSVFATNKDPLVKLLYGEITPQFKRQLVTFGDFSKTTQVFVNKIITNYNV